MIVPVPHNVIIVIIDRVRIQNAAGKPVDLSVLFISGADRTRHIIVVFDRALIVEKLLLTTADSDLKASPAIRSLLIFILCFFFHDPPTLLFPCTLLCIAMY